MSLNDHNDPGLMGATSINSKKYNGNGGTENDIFASPKAFMNGNREDDQSNLYGDLLTVRIYLITKY